MSHTVHPYSYRLGILRDWKSRWISTGKEFRTNLKTDIILREFLTEKLRYSFVSSIEIERSRKALRIIIKTSRPGMIIGKSGEGMTKLREAINKLLDKKGLKDSNSQEIKVDVEEVKNPESDSKIVSMMIATELEKRLPYRRVMKQMIEKIMANKNVQGAKIRISGRLGGSEIARSEDLKKGRIPLQTLRGDIDFAREKAHMTYGDLGIKVWIYKGEIFEKDRQVKMTALGK